MISWENKDNPELFALETKVTGDVHISTAEVGAAVRAFHVPNRVVHVYHILAAGIDPHAIVSAELCIVTVNELHNISDAVNLWSPLECAEIADMLDAYDHMLIVVVVFGQCEK